MKKSTSVKEKSSHIVVKKAKDFLDEKVKSKHRFISLYGYLEGISDLEQEIFIRENSEATYAVCIDVFASQVEKMKSKEKSSKSMTANGKETLTLSRIINCLRKIIIYNPDKIHQGWQKKNLVTAMSILLASNNHIAIRAEGLSLLLLWLNSFLDEKTALPILKVFKSIDDLDKLTDGAISLYSNAISLSVFEPFTLPLPVTIASSEVTCDTDAESSPSAPWTGEGKTRAKQAQIQGGFVVDSTGFTITAENIPILSTPSDPDPEDSLALLDLILRNILNLASLVNKKCGAIAIPTNVDMLVPTKIRPLSMSPKKSMPLSNAIGLSSESNLPVPYPTEKIITPTKSVLVKNFLLTAGGKSCVVAWEMFKRYYMRILLPATARRVGLNIDDREGFPSVPVKILFAFIEFIVKNCLPPTSGKFSDTSLVLNAVIFGSYESREFVHEVIRQALLLPYADAEITKGAIHIIRAWISQNAEDRPSFLQECGQQATGRSDLVINAWLRRYTKNLVLIFLERSDRTNTPNQIVLFKEVLTIFKLIALEVHVHLHPKTWETLLISLLEIHNLMLNAYQNKTAIVISLLAAEDIADIIMETLLCAWVRSATTSEQLWRQLRLQLKKSTTWSQTILQWSKVMMKLTKVVSLHVHGVDLETTKPTTEKKRKKTFGTPSSGKFGHVGLMQSTSYQESQESELSIINPDLKLTIEHKLASFDVAASMQSKNDSAPEFEEPEPIKNSREGKVLSTVFADSTMTDYCPRNITVHYLLHRRIAEFPNLSYLNWNVENALFIWKNILCALGNPNDIAAVNHAEAIKSLVTIWDTLDKGRSIAYGCMCRMMCRRHDQPIPDNLFPHFYRLLIKGLCSDDLHINYAIIMNAVGIFTLSLPGSYLIVPTFVSTIDKKFVQKGIEKLNHPELVRQYAIAILSSLICTFNKYAFESRETDSAITYDLIKKVQELSRNIPLDALSSKAQSPNSAASSKFEEIVNYELPQFEYGLKCQLVGSISVEELKLRLKGLLLSLNHLQMKDLFLSRTATNDDAAKKQEASMTTDDLAKKEESEQDETLGLIMCSIALMAFDEMVVNKSPTKEIVDDCINSLLSHLTTNSLKVLSHTVGALTAMAQNAARLVYMDKNIMKGIIEKIVGALTEVLMFYNDSTTREVKSIIVSKLFYCLLEWIMVSPREVISNPNTAQMLCDVIESALLDEHIVNAPQPEIPKVDATPDAFDSSNEPARTNDRSPTKKGSLFDLTRKTSLSRIKSSPSVAAISLEQYKEISKETEILQLLGFGHLVNQSLSTVVDEFEVANVEENLIKETAENVLEHILHHLNNFAPSHGSEQMFSNISDPAFVDEFSKTNDKYLYFTFNDSTIITLTEIPGATPQGTRARVIARNATGKYVWDSFLFCESIKECQDVANNEQFDTNIPIAPVKSLGVVQDLQFRDDVGVEKSEDKIVSTHQPEYRRSISEMPIWKSNNDTESVDMLDQLLQYIGEVHPDCFFTTNAPPIVSHSTMQLDVEETSLASRIQQHTLDENQHTLQIRERHKIAKEGVKDEWKDENDFSHSPGRTAGGILQPVLSWNGKEVVDCLTQSFVKVAPPKAQSALPSFQRSRLLLSHLGFLNFGGLKDNSFHLLAKTPALFRDIKGLDKKLGREAIKVAVIYVKEGQEDEQSILRNDRGSIEYEAFVKSLGWEIDIASHPGYLGGLEKSLQSGKTAIYYCTSTLEVIYHEATKMPNDPTDPKQVKMKRHIGNDQVHIVWNEHTRDYKRHTIGGDFGNAQIIITPMVNGLYAIEMPTFGILQSKMVVSQAALGPLVRMTAIQAYRASLALQRSGQPQLPGVKGVPMYRPSYSQRAGDIKLITSRHKVQKWTYERFLESVFMSGAEGNIEPDE